MFLTSPRQYSPLINPWGRNWQNILYTCICVCVSVCLCMCVCLCKQCRERYVNVLDPTLLRGPFTPVHIYLNPQPSTLNPQPSTLKQLDPAPLWPSHAGIYIYIYIQIQILQLDPPPSTHTRTHACTHTRKMAWCLRRWRSWVREVRTSVKRDLLPREKRPTQLS
jgi:hypothetical protein